MGCQWSGSRAFALKLARPTRTRSVGRSGTPTSVWYVCWGMTPVRPSTSAWRRTWSAETRCLSLMEHPSEQGESIRISDRSSDHLRRPVRRQFRRNPSGILRGARAGGNDGRDHPRRQAAASERHAATSAVSSPRSPPRPVPAPVRTPKNQNGSAPPVLRTAKLHLRGHVDHVPGTDLGRGGSRLDDAGPASDEVQLLAVAHPVPPNGRVTVQHRVEQGIHGARVAPDRDTHLRLRPRGDPAQVG